MAAVAAAEGSVAVVCLDESAQTTTVETSPDGRRLVLPVPEGYSVPKASGSGKKKRKAEAIGEGIQEYPLSGTPHINPSPFLRSLQQQQQLLQEQLFQLESEVDEAVIKRNKAASVLQKATLERREREDAAISRFAQILRFKTERLRELEQEKKEK